MESRKGGVPLGGNGGHGGAVCVPTGGRGVSSLELGEKEGEGLAEEEDEDPDQVPLSGCPLPLFIVRASGADTRIRKRLQPIQFKSESL